jgi:isochorismate hydrolase
LDTWWTTALWRQFGAAIDMLEDALVACPAALWHERLWSTPSPPEFPPQFAEFWYVTYHTLVWRARRDAHQHKQGETMTTLENRPHTALLVVDVQNGVVAEAHARDVVVANVGTLLERARRELVPVVWVQHSDAHLARGSDAWRIVAELTPGGSEPLVEKHYGDAFEDTTLETVLSGLGVGRLVVVGAQTDACIRSTLHGALVRGYDTILVSDAHTTEDQTAWGAPPPEQVIAHTNLYWTYQTAPGRTAGTVTSTEVDFG